MIHLGFYCSSNDEHRNGERDRKIFPAGWRAVWDFYNFDTSAAFHPITVQYRMTRPSRMRVRGKGEGVCGGLQGTLGAARKWGGATLVIKVGRVSLVR